MDLEMNDSGHGPGVGWLAYCKDTEGNIFGMMQVPSRYATAVESL